MAFDDQSFASERDVYSISRLNREAKTILEGSFPLLWIEGELSNLARPASGHIYFSLKDEAAQVRCAMFRMRNRLINFNPENGMQVLVRARLSLYEARGDFQLLVEHMEEAGDGALRRAFEVLKAKLQQEGLFAAQHKQPLPDIPKAVGVISSATGAALRDILTTLRRRFPSLPVIVYPVLVQGKESAATIAAMLNTVATRNECDVIILARGGGSLEDLWSFNEEIVARAMFDCPIPIVTGIGHEIDFTIADFVADQRAPTPTAAAELISQQGFELAGHVENCQDYLATSMLRILQQKQLKLQWLRKRLPSPQRQVQEWYQRIDDKSVRIAQAMRHALSHYQHRLAYLQRGLLVQNPRKRLQQQALHLQQLQQRLQTQIQQHLKDKQQQLVRLSCQLDTVSPLATLQRGYAIVTRADDQQLVRKRQQVREGDYIHARIADGSLYCRVESHED